MSVVISSTWTPFTLLKLYFCQEIFFASWLHPETFRCKPLRLRCLPVIFLLSMMLVFNCKRWFVKWETVRASFPLSVRMVGVDNQTSQSGLISLPMDFKFKNLFKIYLDLHDDASFVLIWIIRWLDFFHKIETIWWFISSTVDPGKCRTFILRPFPHNVSSIIPFIIESPIITIVPLGHSPLLLFWILSLSLLLTLFLNL